MVIGADSGIAHIASAMNKKTIVLWGPTSFVKNQPMGNNTRFINLKMDCAPCTGGIGLLSESDAYHKCQYDHACMTQITPDMVVKEIQSS